jgi:hypothetical protein
MALLDLVLDRRPGHVGVPAVEVLRQRTRLGLHLTSMGAARPLSARSGSKTLGTPLACIFPRRPEEVARGQSRSPVRAGTVRLATMAAPITLIRGATVGYARRPAPVPERRLHLQATSAGLPYCVVRVRRIRSRLGTAVSRDAIVLPKQRASVALLVAERRKQLLSGLA